MNKADAKKLILNYFPNFEMDELKKIGEGTGNVAFEVNSDLVFRFPKKEENQKQLEREIAVQEILKDNSSLPIPDFSFLPDDHSFVGYKKLLGVPLLAVVNEFKGWDHFSKQIGSFLSGLHSISVQELEGLNVLREEKSFEDWKQSGKEFFEKIRSLVPKRYITQVETFFQSALPNRTMDLVLCHNDLGIEHILVAENMVTGIIDWGGVVVTDPACDFARIYRDVGEQVMDTVLSEYTSIEAKREGLRERAIFYGKCLVFEDVFYGLEHNEYLQKALSALGWMF